MPLTSAEKSKRYRERLKNNPEKYDISKRKSRARSSKQYQRNMKDLDESKKNDMRLEWRQQYASRKRNTNLRGNSNSTETNSNEVHSEVQNINAEIQPKTKLDKTEVSKIRRNVVNILRRENAELTQRLLTLERGFNTLRREMRDLKKKYQDTKQEVQTNIENVTVSRQEDTPLKRSDEFAVTHLAALETPKKELIKRKIFEYNVLTDSLKKTYKSFNNTERNVLKEVFDNEFVKRYKVTTNLTQNIGLKSNIRKKKENKKVAEELKERLRKFYERDDVSRASAGKKECLTNKKVKKQKRYLLDKLRNLHLKYMIEVGKISFSTFKKHRPFYVVAPNLKNLETCACLKHANMQFIINALKSAGILENNDLNMIIASLVCDQTFKGCMYGECNACAENFIKVDEIENNKRVKWFAWKFKNYVYNEKGTTKTSKRMAKMEKTGPINELLDSFHVQLKAFKIHLYNVRHQYKQYKLCIENLDNNEAAIHIDFSENWVAKYNEEVQAMHFGASKTQITLHTGVLYVKNAKPFSFCSISAENSHGPEAIWGLLHPIMKHIRSAHPNINNLHFHSDGPTTQYKQKKNFYLLCTKMYELGFNATWSFFEASHGKGAADGIGGSVKRALHFKVSHGLDIPDAQTAFEVLQNAESTVKMFLVPPENIQRLDTSIVQKLLPIRNTLKIHQLITHSKFAVKHRILSCFCQSLKGKCECHNPELHVFNFDEKSPNDCQMEKVDESCIFLDEVTGNIIKSKKICNKHNTVDLNDEDIFPVDFNKEDIFQTKYLDDASTLLPNIDEITEDFFSKKRKIEDNLNLTTNHKKNKRLKRNTFLKEKRSLIDSSDEENESDNYSVHDSSDSDFAAGTDSEVTDDNDFERNKDTNIEVIVGSFVLVKFLTEKRTKRYIGEVTEIYENGYKVKFLRNKGKGKFAWPITEDKSVVYRSDIEQILQKPKTERRGLKTFDIEDLSIIIE